MKPVFKMLCIGCLAGAFLLGQPNARAQIFFNGSAGAQDNAPGDVCTAVNGLLPQLNPPAAVANCTATGGAIPASATSSAGAYPSNGMVSISTVVASSEFFAGQGGVGRATATVTDTYWPTYLPPGGAATAAALALTFELSGQQETVCTGTLGGILCDSDHAQLEVDPGGYFKKVAGVTADSQNLFVVAPCQGMPIQLFLRSEQFTTDGVSVIQEGLGQVFVAYYCWVGNTSVPLGLSATVGMTVTNEAFCQGFDASCLSLSNVLNTLRVTGAQIVDVNGNVIPGATIATASGFNPNTAQGLLFSSFTGKLEISTSIPSSFDLSGSFTLGSGSTGIDPVGSGITFSVGSYSVVVPSGAFVKQSKGSFVYQGTIGGVALQFAISPTTRANTFTIKAEGGGMNAPPSTANPVPVKLVIGNNNGGANFTAQFQ